MKYYLKLNQKINLFGHNGTFHNQIQCHEFYSCLDKLDQQLDKMDKLDQHLDELEDTIQ